MCSAEYVCDALSSYSAYFNTPAALYYRFDFITISLNNQLTQTKYRKNFFFYIVFRIFRQIFQKSCEKQFGAFIANAYCCFR